MIGMCWLFLFLNKGQWNWVGVMGRGMRENSTQMREFFIVASKKQSLVSTALLFIVWVFKFNRWKATDVHERVNHRSYTNI